MEVRLRAESGTLSIILMFGSLEAANFFVMWIILCNPYKNPKK